MSKRVVTYARASTEDQAKQDYRLPGPVPTTLPHFQMLKKKEPVLSTGSSLLRFVP